MNNHNEDLQPPLVGHTTLDFGIIPKGRNFSWEELITNTNHERLLWCGDTGETSWLVLTPSAGSLEPGEQQKVTITANMDNLEVGNHKATFFFNWEGDDYSVSTEVNATFGVAHMSPLAVGLSFSLFPMSSKTLPLAITNRFDKTVEWIVDSGDTSWLTLDRDSGTLKPHEQQTIYVTANSSPLHIGDYAATLTFTPEVKDIERKEMEDSRSKSVQIPVELHVHIKPYSDSGPKMPVIHPNSIDFPEHTFSSASLRIINQERRGSVRWTLYTGGVDWITLEPSSGTFQRPEEEAQVNVRINTDALTSKNSTDLRLTLAFIDTPLSSREPTSILIPVTISDKPISGSH